MKISKPREVNYIHIRELDGGKDRAITVAWRCANFQTVVFGLAYCSPEDQFSRYEGRKYSTKRLALREALYAVPFLDSQEMSFTGAFPAIETDFSNYGYVCDQLEDILNERMQAGECPEGFKNCRVLSKGSVYSNLRGLVLDEF